MEMAEIVMNPVRQWKAVKRGRLRSSPPHRMSR